MRTLPVILALAVSAVCAQAQDPATQAAQQQLMIQTQLNAQAASQNAQQMMQQAQQAGQAFQQASQIDSPPPVCCSIYGRPKFSLKPGTYTSPQTVKITASARGAVIYYTTDGWAPTPASNRYMGPIAINSTTTLQAIAIVPYYWAYGANYSRSFVVSAKYIINAPVAATSPATSNLPPPVEATPEGAGNGTSTLPAGTPVPLLFAADVTSKTASIGDPIPLTLAEDLRVGNLVVAPKGSAAVGVVTQVDKPGAGGVPGDLSFQVNSLTVNGKAIKLTGFASKEGDAKPPNIGTLMIPGAGPFFVLKHGSDAQINKGAPITAYVDVDTPVPAAK